MPSNDTCQGRASYLHRVPGRAHILCSDRSRTPRHGEHPQPLSPRLRPAAVGRGALCRLRDPVRGHPLDRPLVYAGLSVVLKLGVFLPFGMYSRLWRQASIPDMAKIVQATALSTSVCAALGLLVLPLSGLTALRLPISVLILDSFLTVTAVSAPRLLIRGLGTLQRFAQMDHGRRALIAGAGAAGEMILRELRANPQLGLTPVGFVDDDPRKHDHRLNDLPVFGALAEIPAIIARYRIDEIVIAMPTAPGRALRTVVRAATDAHIPTRTVPALFEILSGRVSLSHLRKVEIQDLLRREPVQTNLGLVRAMVSGHTVLVTGAGGSIGSELARQLAQLEPARLVLLGNGENEIFDILNELRAAHPALHLSSPIADVRDLPRMRSVFRRLHPHAVFHAAAHKHVPLMEENVADAVTNNVGGTGNIVDCAVECGTQHFVLISTDKAVRPTSVMGATKRVAEMIVQEAAVRHGRNFVSVRFGNVLGSRGSVVPIFLSQIRAGGPLTITHPDMRRYFMTGERSSSSTWVSRSRSWISRRISSASRGSRSGATSKSATPGYVPVSGSTKSRSSGTKRCSPRLTPRFCERRTITCSLAPAPQWTCWRRPGGNPVLTRSCGNCSGGSCRTSGLRRPTTSATDRGPPRIRGHGAASWAPPASSSSAARRRIAAEASVALE